jgi:hypothetical protein
MSEVPDRPCGSPRPHKLELCGNWFFFTPLDILISEEIREGFRSTWPEIPKSNPAKWGYPLTETPLQYHVDFILGSMTRSRCRKSLPKPDLPRKT